MKSNPIHQKFLKSAITLSNEMMPTEQIHQWIIKNREAIHVNITPLKFSEMNHWGFDPDTSNLVHESGKFFSIEGIEVKTNWGEKNHWTQPIINQPEIGFLGIITKEFNGVLHFLMQAKIEPGNINFVQLSPTLQATKSNYTKVHKGKSPLYLEYFNGEWKGKKRVLLDQLQSEQGARFLQKRNRNIIIEIFDDLELYENFCWVTLGQIKQLLLEDNVINMDTRTVISGIPFGNYPNEIVHFLQSVKTYKPDSDYEMGLLASAVANENHLHPIEDIISWVTEMKTRYELEIKRISLSDLTEWKRDDYSIFHQDQKYFKVIGVEASIENREVTKWHQPLVQSAQEGLIAFIIKEINGTYHFLVQAKLEAGNFDIVELAPTVQCLTGNYKETAGPPYLQYVLEAPESQIRHSTFQSEEGGRFYREQNKNVIIEAHDDFDHNDIPENYIWMTLNQIHTFITFNNYLNIQSRSLISTLKFI